MRREGHDSLAQLLWFDQPVIMTAVIFLICKLIIYKWKWKFTFRPSIRYSNMINSDRIISEWSENVVPVHAVPHNLFPHQVDAMALVKEGRHVFLGIYSPTPDLLIIIYHYLKFRCPNWIWKNSPTVSDYPDNARASHSDPSTSGLKRYKNK